jgi:nitrogen regulatory protein PII
MPSEPRAPAASLPFEPSDARTSVKRIEAFIRHFKIDEVKQALRRTPISGAILTELWSIGTAARGPRWAYAKMEVVVHDDLVERVVTAIEESAGTRPAPGGTIMISAVEQAVGLPNGEIDEAAIA